MLKDAMTGRLTGCTSVYEYRVPLGGPSGHLELRYDLYNPKRKIYFANFFLIGMRKPKNSKLTVLAKLNYQPLISKLTEHYQSVDDGLTKWIICYFCVPALSDRMPRVSS